MAERGKHQGSIESKHFCPRFCRRMPIMLFSGGELPEKHVDITSSEIFGPHETASPLFSSRSQTVLLMFRAQFYVGPHVTTICQQTHVQVLILPTGPPALAEFTNSVLLSKLDACFLIAGDAWWLNCRGWSNSSDLPSGSGSFAVEWLWWSPFPQLTGYW